MKIGYVGLGVMGGALAERLLQSGPLAVHDLGEAARARFASAAAPAKRSGARS
ncbi:NAD(P)-binding domain-containing protein [Mangrovicoccus ximenensis]|uniref:NAD(P)-binding domain-containing protein n=1 Tax=Mangrovicoccus ximenensis TaxID=1911570 RepID=UPI001374C653